MKFGLIEPPTGPLRSAKQKVANMVTKSDLNINVSS